MRSMIETERLRLRPLQMSDAPRVARFVGDPGVACMIARAPLPYLEVAAEGWIMTLAARAPLAEDFVYAAELPGEGLVGVIGAHKLGQHGDGRANFEVGYWFGRPYWGQGIATETLSGFLPEARALGALQAGHFVDNPASGRVLEKAGFAYTGETTEMFSLGRGERVVCRRMHYARDAAAGFAREAAIVH